VLNFINPKFNDQHEIELAEAELYGFALKCELTANEFLLALELAADGKLITEPDENGNTKRVQMFREIDRLKLGEVKSAYIYHKTIDRQHESGKAKIRAFLEPVQPELTPEQKKAEREKFFRTDYARLQNEGKVLGTVLFYDLIKKSGIQKVNLKFVENVLDHFKPETVEASAMRLSEPQLARTAKVIKHNAKTFFIDALVHAYFEKENLKSMTENEFVEYWEEI